MGKRRYVEVDRPEEVERLVGVANGMMSHARKLIEQEDLLNQGVDVRVGRSLQLAQVALDLAERLSSRGGGNQESVKPKIVGEAWWE